PPKRDARCRPDSARTARGGEPMVRRASCLGSLALLALSAAAAARADAPDEPKAILEKAIKARGGTETLTKKPPPTTQYKGRFHEAGRAIEYTETTMTQPGCF